MRKMNLVGISFVVLLLAGCSTAEMAEVNKKISDFSAGLVSVGKNDDAGQQGYGVLSKGKKQVKEVVDQTSVIPTNIDTAAARLKKYYSFKSTEEVQALKAKGTSGSIKASAITEDGYEWYAQPGSQYVMGSAWGIPPENQLKIELINEGGKTNMTVTYRSADPSIRTDPSITRLFQQVKSVAEGKTR